MLRIFDGGCPGSRTWDGEANHTVSRLCACKIKKLFLVLAHLSQFEKSKKYIFFLRQSNKKAEVISPG